MAGIFFPALFFLLISIREHLLPKIFDPQYLQVLDASDYEEIVAAPIQHSSFAYRVKLFFSGVLMSLKCSQGISVNKCVIPLNHFMSRNWDLLVIQKVKMNSTTQRYWTR